MSTVVFSERAAKQFWRLSNTVQSRVKAKLKYRFRVGDYRILFDYNQKQILILEIGHRREIYQ